MAWQLLLGYLPPNRAWREATLQRKRSEYLAAIPQYFDLTDAERAAMMYQSPLDFLGMKESDLEKHKPNVDFRCTDRFTYMEN